MVKVRMTHPISGDKMTMGEIRDNIYITHKWPGHYFVKYKGYGISYNVLEHLRMNSIDDIRIIYHGVRGNLILNATVELFFSRGIVYEQPYLDEKGNIRLNAEGIALIDTQLILPERFFRRDDEHFTKAVAGAFGG